MAKNGSSGSPAISTCRVILLLDMDAFYASVEQRDNPALQGQPVIVGESVPRSIVTTASREARKFGIHSGMPMTQARKLCPHGHFIAPRMSHYRTISQNIRQLVATVAGPMAVLEPVALDEIYIDLTPYCSAATDDDALRLAFPYAANMKVAIIRAENLTCTVGVASNKMLAKLASDHNKPNGVGIILESKKIAALSPMPVKVLAGVGEKREEQLKAAGILTVQDIRNYSGDLRNVVGNSLGSKLPDLANGIDSRPVQPPGPPKSISREHTFTPKNESNPVNLDAVLQSQAAYIEAQLNAHKLVAFTVFVVACHKYPNEYTRQESVTVAVSSAADIFAGGQRIIKAHGIYSQSLYKLGLGVTKLCPQGAPAKKSSGKSGKGASENLTLFDTGKL